MVFFDPDGLIRDTFNAPFDELDYPVVITGPSFLWRGAVRRGLVGRPVAVRVYQQQTSLFIYDRLQALQELTGISTVGADLADLLRSLFLKINPGPDILVQTDLKVLNSQLNPYLLSKRRFDGELAGAGRGDYGSGLDQIEALCLSHGYLCFMDTTTGDFAFYHRASMPFQRVTATLIVIDTDGSLSEITGQSRTPLIITAGLTGRRSDEFVTNQGTGTILLEDVGAIDWIKDGSFSVVDDTGLIFEFWATTGNVFKNEGTDRVATGSGGGSTEQFIGSFSPVTDVRPRFRFDFFGNNVKAEVRLVDTTGTTHYLADNGLWTTTVSEWSFSTSVLTQATVVALSGEDFPAAGDLFFKLSAANPNRQWGDVEMFLIDGASALIDDWTFSVGTGEGASITLASVPKLLAETDGIPTLADAVMESELTGIAFERINVYLVSDRLAQDTPNQDNIKGGIFAVVGPEAVLRVTDDLGNQVDYVAVGGDIDFEKGTTEGVWLALDDLQGTVGS